MKYDQLFIHPSARRLLDAYLDSPTHALLISGARGSGSGTLARAIAQASVDHDADIYLVEPDEKGTITIEAIRELYVWTRDKKTKPQVVLIDGADQMSHDAQHAFLKLLEEPNDLTRFVLTAHYASRLLPTIFSRLQHIELRPVSLSLSQKLVDSLVQNDAQKTKQILFLAQGLPAEVSRLATNAEYFAMRSALAADARILMSGSTYDRLEVISRYKDRNEALELIGVLSQMLVFMLEKKTDEQIDRLAKTAERTAAAIRANGHVRTQLMRLALR